VWKIEKRNKQNSDGGWGGRKAHKVLGIVSPQLLFWGKKEEFDLPSGY